MLKLLLFRWKSARFVVTPILLSHSLLAPLEAAAQDQGSALAVQGVIASEDAKASVAVMRMGSETKVVRPGDRLGASASVLAIEPGGVVVEALGKKIRLPIGSGLDGSEASVVQSAGSSTPVPAKRYEGIELRGNHVQISESLRNHILKNELQAVLMQAAAVPYYVNGRLGGFRLWEIQPESIFERLGLKDGDLVTAINGIELTDVGMAIRVLNSLRGENSAELSYNRDGLDASLKISIN